MTSKVNRNEAKLLKRVNARAVHALRNVEDGEDAVSAIQCGWCSRGWHDPSRGTCKFVADALIDAYWSLVETCLASNGNAELFFDVSAHCFPLRAPARVRAIFKDGKQRSYVVTRRGYWWQRARQEENRTEILDELVTVLSRRLCNLGYYVRTSNGPFATIAVLHRARRCECDYTDSDSEVTQ